MKIAPDAIRPVDGVIPPRPTCLQHPTVRRGLSIDEAIAEIIEEGKAIALGGISVIGERLYVVSVISLLQMKDRVLRGWPLAIGHPEKEELEFDLVDTSVSFPAEYPFPSTMIYFVAEADEKVVAVDAPAEELQAIARFVLPFISDEGPPRGIDW